MCDEITQTPSHTQFMSAFAFTKRIASFSIVHNFASELGPAISKRSICGIFLYNIVFHTLRTMDQNCRKKLRYTFAIFRAHLNRYTVILTLGYPPKYKFVVFILGRTLIRNSR